MRCSGYCTPFIIYIVISIIVILLNLTRNIPTETKVYVALRQLVFTLLWGGLLYWLCHICKQGWAWFLLFINLFLGIIILIVMAILLEWIIIRKNEIKVKFE